MPRMNRRAKSETYYESDVVVKTEESEGKPRIKERIKAKADALNERLIDNLLNLTDEEIKSMSVKDRIQCVTKLMDANKENKQVTNNFHGIENMSTMILQLNNDPKTLAMLGAKEEHGIPAEILAEVEVIEDAEGQGPDTD